MTQDISISKNIKKDDNSRIIQQVENILFSRYDFSKKIDKKTVYTKKSDTELEQMREEVLEYLNKNIELNKKMLDITFNQKDNVITCKLEIIDGENVYISSY